MKKLNAYLLFRRIEFKRHKICTSTAFTNDRVCSFTGSGQCMSRIENKKGQGGGRVIGAMLELVVWEG